MKEVITCPISGIILRYDGKADSWYVIANEQRYNVGEKSDGSILCVLPFLEFPISAIEKRVSELQVDFPDIDFPYETILHSAFKIGTRHWTSCALKWMLDLGNTISVVNFALELENVCKNKKIYDQRSRQIALRLLKSAANTSTTPKSGTL